MSSPFATTIHGEVLSSEIVALQCVDLAIALLGIAVTFGVERTEQAIYATYPRASASRIVAMMNTAMSLAGVKTR